MELDEIGGDLNCNNQKEEEKKVNIFTLLNLLSTPPTILYSVL